MLARQRLYFMLPDIEALIEKRHPEAKFGGVESHIPVFP